MTAEQIKQQLFTVSDPEKREFFPRFFKTCPGGYGEGDKFIGVVVPKQREIVKHYKQLPFAELELLIRDEYHECRLTALLFLAEMFKRTKHEEEVTAIYNFYIRHLFYINNWDLVDLSAPAIVGNYLKCRDRKILSDFAKEKHLWTQRIAIIATFAFIKNKDYESTLSIASLLLYHPHDLIHKAVGWMLREVGKRDFETEYLFLVKKGLYKTMPRTMLRYAIEKFPEELRIHFLQGTI